MKGCVSAAAGRSMEQGSFSIVPPAEGRDDLHRLKARGLSGRVGGQGEFRIWRDGRHD
jgi:hypothetical protein